MKISESKSDILASSLSEYSDIDDYYFAYVDEESLKGWDNCYEYLLDDMALGTEMNNRRIAIYREPTDEEILDEICHALVVDTDLLEERLYDQMVYLDYDIFLTDKEDVKLAYNFYRKGIREYAKALKANSKAYECCFPIGIDVVLDEEFVEHMQSVIYEE